MMPDLPRASRVPHVFALAFTLVGVGDLPVISYAGDEGGTPLAGLTFGGGK
jgi:hypothetical protein